MGIGIVIGILHEFENKMVRTGVEIIGDTAMKVNQVELNSNAASDEELISNTHSHSPLRHPFKVDKLGYLLDKVGLVIWRFHDFTSRTLHVTSPNSRYKTMKVGRLILP